MGIVNGSPLEQSATPDTPRRVVVKLHEAAAAASHGLHVAAAFGGTWNALADTFPGVQARPYFAGDLDMWFAASAPPPPAPSLIDTRRYLAVDVPEGIDAMEVAVTLQESPAVESAYPEGGPTPPPLNPFDDPRSANQGYLSAAPDGIDARWAWSSAAADGAGVGFVDLERGWTLDHEDLAGANITIISGENRDYHGHGTAVLGEVASRDNALGGIGIAPAATTRVVSQWRGGTAYSTAAAILSAAAAMQPGDVLLLEAQTTFPTAPGYVPVEVEDLVFDAIHATVASGIIVIEAAGNGSVDLDQFVDLRGRAILNRNSSDFRDSGAILVGAASAGVPHQRLGFSNFGTRIDCFAWGELIDTCGDGGVGQAIDTYTTGFGGTSGASPIVTGCALLLQSWRLHAGLARCTATEMRRLLADPSVNTSSSSPASDRIGVMPDLRAIIQGHTAAASIVPPAPADSTALL